ncbi:MAG TPA: 50S ribosomal protein L15 [Candidatus Poseidoniaceae archaeon]|jgi:large subunit ribosomal protein L15|nr:uL15m family ribosomal protein [Candidatus Thermoplasmatota archaeon]DAC54344.1 MAG TPA: 50S ribosomal protein L15 [Candidatus Poseidoniales archaeon]DAC60642.1 MAG TPA: 50S ribosomal protein L15 [Candidatus Poseidoniales archaeon]HII23069.1 50S ribosomal protein L15 [Candidatus Poseidoniaceae archaeon]HII50084.1 50S ribosomal protein L15 [Candidatus Poseidoniaceae archaeon]|tara:strand:- start:2583 stop:3008 length:426 start_codon:yes stop_codon:yes gene_type:complete
MGIKANKHRGRNRYHGRGKKAGRGAGKRGGRGLAGINKHRVMTRIKYMPKHWGMHGFNRHPSLRNVNVTVNVGQLENMAGDKDSVNLTEMGIDKLLGSGRISKALTVTVSEASAKAVEKIEAAGGSLETDSDEDWGEWEEE